MEDAYVKNKNQNGEHPIVDALLKNENLNMMELQKSLIMMMRFQQKY